MNESGKRTVAASNDVEISVTDFGPIARGTVDLRPLTVFVGPSNTGKTYFAVLIYALHRILEGFPRFPATFHLDEEPAEPVAGVEGRELQDVLEKLDAEKRPFKFSDLPGSVRAMARAALNNPDRSGAVLDIEIERCFDLDSASELVRASGNLNRLTASLNVSENDRSLWHFRTNISKSGLTAEGSIEDMVLIPEGMSVSKFGLSAPFERIRNHDKWLNFEDLLRLLSEIANRGMTGDAHYLPAVRSGIMQSQRFIASSLVARSTRATSAHGQEFPTFSGVMADFMQKLILCRERPGLDQPMNALADALEDAALAGRILTRQSPGGGYPEFVYRPRKMNRDLRLTQASSMVSELAPIVLFLRGAVDSGDTLIIEEPEAHLHPAAQTRMAVVLAGLVRAGVRVVVTTHSDWLLKEIANLMREGELEFQEKAHHPAKKESLPSALRPADVGIWLFRRDRDSAGSIVEEIPFDRSEGVEPEDYEDVAEALYNRSADLQNRFEQAATDVERERE